MWVIKEENVDVNIRKALIFVPSEVLWTVREVWTTPGDTTRGEVSWKGLAEPPPIPVAAAPKKGSSFHLLVLLFPVSPGTGACGLRNGLRIALSCLYSARLSWHLDPLCVCSARPWHMCWPLLASC